MPVPACCLVNNMEGEGGGGVLMRELEGEKVAGEESESEWHQTVEQQLPFKQSCWFCEQGTEGRLPRVPHCAPYAVITPWRNPRRTPSPECVFSSFHSWRCLMPGSLFITINATDTQLISHPALTNTHWNQSGAGPRKIKVTISPPRWAERGLQYHCHVFHQLPTERKKGGREAVTVYSIPRVHTTTQALGKRK